MFHVILGARIAFVQCPNRTHHVNPYPSACILCTTNWFLTSFHIGRPSRIDVFRSPRSFREQNLWSIPSQMEVSGHVTPISFRVCWWTNFGNTVDEQIYHLSWYATLLYKITFLSCSSSDMSNGKWPKFEPWWEEEYRNWFVSSKLNQWVKRVQSLVIYFIFGNFSLKWVVTCYDTKLLRHPPKNAGLFLLPRNGA